MRFFCRNNFLRNCNALGNAKLSIIESNFNYTEKY